MSHLEVIKDQFHDLIDRVQDEAVLVRYLGAIALEVGNVTADSWEDVSPEEKVEILEAYEESKDPTNRISHEDMKRKYAKWLTK